MSEKIDTGFAAVIAGEAYVHPEITATVTEEPPCPTSSQSPATNIPPSASTSVSTPEEKTDATTASVSSLTPAGVQAAKALVQLPKHLDWPTLSRLAREVAMNIKEWPTILQEFGLTQVQYDFLEVHNEFYRSALASACKDWQAPRSTQERLQVEAAAILEDSLLGLGARMQSKGEGLPAAIEAAKLFAKIAGVGEQKQGAVSTGERFVINIDLGGDQKISFNAATSAPAHVGDNSESPLPQISKGD